MNPLIDEALDALRGLGWKVELAREPRPLPPAVASRHPDLPPLAVEFFTGVEHCVSPDEGSWFLAAEDFARAGDAFRWDEYERMALEDADDGAAREVRAFWDRYLPIFHLVEGDYEYLALCTDPSSRQFGKVVWNAEAQYDDNPPVIAGSYEDFLARLRDVARREPARTSGGDATIARLIGVEMTGGRSDGWWAWLKRRLTGENW